jgi:ketosteroid isomerase-like protein
MPSNDLESAIEHSHIACGEIVKGNPEPFELLYSRREDVTVGNPFGPLARGRQAVVDVVTRAASRYRDGEIVGFEPFAKHVTNELACVVEVERYRARVGGSDDLAAIALRVTSVFRLEEGVWKLVHRHADPITTPQPPESVIQQEAG